MLLPRMPKTTPRIRTVRISGDRRAYLRPAPMAISMFSGGRKGAGRGLRQRHSTTIRPTYETELTRNAADGPALATITPPIAGPAVRAMLNDTLFRATAAGRSARGTCSPTEDCQAGP